MKVYSKKGPDVEKYHSILEKILGVILVALGIVAIVVPFIPAWLLIIIGLTLLGQKRIVRFWYRRMISVWTNSRKSYKENHRRKMYGRE